MKLSPEQWQRIDALFDEALDRPPAQRSAFLKDACDDEGLRREVEKLLDASDRATSFLERPVGATAESLWDQWAAEAEASRPTLEGKRLGPYRVIEEVGRGGMATVYRAERADGAYRQEVAIKLVAPFRYSEDLLRRFRAERQILAGLDHPGIARLLDGGVTSDGWPYFAMEYVEGTPIDRYCDEQDLSVRERLELFVKVTGAVGHAHRRLVVHRDLKPSNILVASDGNGGTPRVKLLDFGIAKLLSGEALEASTLPMTRTGQHLMTPEYASPEQVRGDSITTASDVYQLGVLLYELLAGKRPFQFERYAPGVLEEVICEEEPPKPSTVAGQREKKPADASQDASEGPASEGRASEGSASEGRAQALRGDLDTIVMKALRKELERRYASVKGFADDVRSHLRGLPVKARRPTWHYRTRKFAARHRWGVAGGGVFVAFVVGFMALLLVQQNRTERERDRARTEAQKAEQVSSFLADLFEATNPGKGRGSVTARTLLDLGADRLKDNLASQPDVQIHLMNIIGSAYRNRGFYEKALALQRRALALSQNRLDAPTRQLADLHNNVGEALYFLGRYDEALVYYKRSLSLRRQLLGERHVDVAQSLHNLSLVDLFQDRLASAERRARRSVAIFESALGDEHWRIANAKTVRARILRAQGRLGKARSLSKEALAMHQRLPVGKRYGVARAVTRNDLGRVLCLQGHARAAEEAHRQALASFRRLLPRDHAFTGRALLGLAQALHAQKRYREAESFYRKALAHQQRALPDGDPRRTEPMVELGRLLVEAGREGEADPLLRRALSLREKILSTEHRKIAEVKGLLGTALTQQQRYEEAEPLLLRAYETMRSKRDPAARRSRRKATSRLAQLYDAWGKFEQAAAYQDSLPRADR